MSECKCFDQVIEKVNEKLKRQLPAKEAETFRSRWKNKSIFLSGGAMAEKVAIPVEYEYQKFKKSGEPYKHSTRESLRITMSYCPFCGTYLKKDEGSDG
mgnify:CR=1 FL=1